MEFIDNNEQERKIDFGTPIYPDASDMDTREFTNGANWFWIILSVFALFAICSCTYGIFCFYENHIKPLFR